MGEKRLWEGVAHGWREPLLRRSVLSHCATRRAIFRQHTPLCNHDPMTRTKTIACLTAVAAVLLTTDRALPQQSKSNSAITVKARVDALLSRMTLEEKIGQLTQVGGIALSADSPKPEEAIRKGQAGSILWISDAPTINRLQKVAMEESRLKIPLIFGLDVIHGFETIFPMPLALSASWDMSLIEHVQSIAAREARAAGIAWTFAPMVDIARDPRWGRMIEGAGEDPFLGAAVARAQVRGFQGTDLSQPDRVLACAKHFAGYGAATGGRTTTPPSSPSPSCSTSTCLRSRRRRTPE